MSRESWGRTSPFPWTAFTIPPARVTRPPDDHRAYGASPLLDRYRAVHPRMDGALVSVRPGRSWHLDLKHTKKLPGGGELVEVYETHRPPNAKYAAWWLERRMPERFGRRVEKTGHMKVDTGEQRIVYEFVAPDGTVETLVVDPEDEGGGTAT